MSNAEHRLPSRSRSTVVAALAFALCALGFGVAVATAEAPEATAPQVSGVSYASAHVEGQVDPKGQFTEWFFEVSANGTDWEWKAGGSKGENGETGLQSVEADLEGLKGGTTYQVRLGAMNYEEFVTYHSPEPNPEFTTLAVDPPAFAAADEASEVAYTTAKATGEVERPSGNPNSAFDVNCRFDYITDAQYEENIANSAPGFENAASADCAQNPVTAEGTKTPVSADLGGLSLGTTYHLRLHAENAGGILNADAPDTFTTLTPDPPAVTIDPVTTFTSTTATFSGTIDPEAAGGDPVSDVDWHFQCSPECPSLSIASSPTPNPIPADSAVHTVEAKATGLDPNTTYDVTLVAKNAGDPVEAGPVSFKTVAVAPEALTIPAFVLEGGTSALVGARVNPHNSPTTYWLEYGETEAYGQSIPTSEDVAAGSNNQFNFLTQTISGLSPETTYHFRVTAKNDSGEIQGEDLTFKTPPPAGPPASCPNQAFRTGPSANLPDCRAYESVTPQNLLGARTYVARVAEKGEAALWETSANLPGDDASGINNTYLTQRKSTGWTSTIVSLPGRMTTVSYGSGVLQFATPNLDGPFIWQVYDAINPEDPDPTGNGPAFYEDLYRRELDGSFTWLTRGSDIEPAANDGIAYIGASADGLTVFFTNEGRQYEPDAPNGGLYIRSGQSTSVVKDEHGSVVPVKKANIFGGMAVSADGSVVAFGFNNPSSKLYVYQRSLGYAVLVDAPSGINRSVSSRVLAVSPNGSQVFFETTSDLLPDDVDSNSDPNYPPFDIYEYEVSTGTLRRLSGTVAGPGPGNGAASANSVLVTPDGSAVYFTSTEQLDGGKGVSGYPNLYRAEGGVIHYAMTLTGELQKPQLSGDGKTLVFESSDRLTAYDNSGHSEIYAYHSTDGSTICVSCRPSGVAPQGDAVIGSSLQRGVDQHGERFFFQTTDAILSQDLNNGKADVYEFDAAQGAMSLISTGSSVASSYFGGISADGRDAFFTTLESLLPKDENVGTQKVFDARIGGGFPETVSVPPCEGEGCRGAGSAKPTDVTAPTSIFAGPGNPKHKKHRPKKRHHRKHKHHKSQKRSANGNGRNGR